MKRFVLFSLMLLFSAFAVFGQEKYKQGLAAMQKGQYQQAISYFNQQKREPNVSAKTIADCQAQIKECERQIKLKAQRAQEQEQERREQARLEQERREQARLEQERREQEKRERQEREQRNREQNHLADVMKEQEEEEEIPFAIVEEKPTFQGQDANAFTQWVYANIDYPEVAKVNGIQGRVTVQFSIDKDGYVKDVHVLQGADSILDKEAVRVISKSPKWSPGKQRNKPVRVKFTFPIFFKLRR